MSAAFFQALGRLALVFKLVVAEDGNVIARNYSTDSKSKLKLKPGDIGVHCRVDLGSTKGEYTPAQELALAQVAPRVADAFLSSCGVEPAGFSHGDIVKLEDGTNALVLQDKGTIMRVQKINDKGKLVRCTRHNENVEEVPVEKKGLVGLLLAELHSNKLMPNFTDLSLEPFLLEQVFAHIKKGKLVEALIKTIAKQKDPFEFAAALEVVAMYPQNRMGDRVGYEVHELQASLRHDILEKSQDARRYHYYALLYTVERRRGEWKEALAWIPEDQKDALVLAASKFDIAKGGALPFLKADEKAGISYPGRKAQLLKALETFNDECVDTYVSAPHLLRALTEEGLELLVEQYDEEWYLEDFHGKEGAFLLRYMLDSRRNWNDDTLQDFLSLKGVVTAPSSFWMEIEFGFDKEIVRGGYAEESFGRIRPQEAVSFLNWGLTLEELTFFDRKGLETVLADHLEELAKQDSFEDSARDMLPYFERFPCYLAERLLKLLPESLVPEAIQAMMRVPGESSPLVGGSPYVERLVVKGCEDPDWLLQHGGKMGSCRSQVYSRLLTLGVPESQVSKLFP